ncbi:sensor histidine kinase [Actinomadura fibrosa]|uniref:Oxygen sensor histidine kinase NreB n=1 Tax=Actinomadura fibrosa TaxID=111802 RepID=A0ABW2XZG2_9ACTN|nr:sensor histidine kinase [Actinomadura fibrosa]
MQESETGPDVQESGHGFDEWERREKVALRYVPFVALGLATAAAMLADRGSESKAAVMLALTAATAAWIGWMVRLHPVLGVRRHLSGVYYGGLLLMLGALVALSPLYGFAVITGYLHADLLAPRWRLPGVFGTATLAATAQVGGIGNLHGAKLPVFLLVLAVNALLAGGFCLFAWRGDEESKRRRAMIEQLAEANARLEETMAENAALHARLLAQARAAGVHDERQRMAGEIHDTIAQGLAGVVTQLQAARQAPERGRDWLRHVELAQEMARESLAEARRSVRALRPQQLEDAGLPEALAGVADRWTALHGVPVEVNTTGAVRSMHPEVEETLLRTTQEALANVAKHAGASRVALSLAYEGDQVTLDVRDDGAGFAPDSVRPRGDGGYGLTAMRRRVARVAGTLEIASEPGAGTAVSARVPAIPLLNGA